MKWLGCICLGAVLLAVSGFSTQPLDERTAQSILPQAQDALWKKFLQCKVNVDFKKYTYSINFTPEIKAMEGKTVTISGFIMPIESTETFTHYLLSKRTPTCPFCPPGDPNEVVEVFSKEPIAWEEAAIVVTGTLKLTNDPDKGLFFQIKNGESMSTKGYEEKKMPVF